MVDAGKSLFDGEQTEHLDKKLVLVAQTRRALTKAQQTFNRLVKRIETLNAELRDESSRLDKELEYFEKHVQPQRVRLAEGRKKLVLALAAYLEPGMLKKSERETLSDVLVWQLNEVSAEQGTLPQEFHAIFEKVHGVSYDEAASEEMESMRSQIKEMFEEFGVDVDLSGLRSGMTQEDMAQEAARIVARMRAQKQAQEEEAQASKRSQQKKTSKKESKKQEVLSQAQEARKTSIAKIYRDLARVLHPDLEPDETIRPRKVDLMAKLTSAYRSNDLHTILSLELEWMEHEDEHVQRMTDEKLGIYNKVLQEQASDLESQVESVSQHPRYQDIFRRRGVLGIQQPIDGKQETQRLKLMLKSMEVTLARLDGSDGVSEVRRVVREYRTHLRGR
jgi:hypothetical protein